MADDVLMGVLSDAAQRCRESFTSIQLLMFCGAAIFINDQDAAWMVDY
jgi:hypothetical protein